MSRVVLEWYEVALASEVARLRQLESLRRSLPDRHGYEGAGWTEHVEGACGELAVAKFLGVYWNGSVGTFKGCDLPGLQVRTRSRHDYDLIVRADDAEDATFVLVTGRAPEFAVRGWITGAAAKQARWLAAHGGRPPAFFVPQAELHPLERRAAA